MPPLYTRTFLGHQGQRCRRRSCLLTLSEHLVILTFCSLIRANVCVCFVLDIQMRIHPSVLISSQDLPCYLHRQEFKPLTGLP